MSERYVAQDVEKVAEEEGEGNFQGQLNRGCEGTGRAQGREMEDVERSREQVMGGEGRTQGKRSMSCEEEGKASVGEKESKTHKRS